MKKNEIKPHPLIELKEKIKEDLVELSGYIGSTKGSKIKIYTSLSAQEYYSIPEKDILHMEERNQLCGSQGVITVYIRASTEIEMIQLLKASERYAAHSHSPWNRTPIRSIPHVPNPNIPRDWLIPLYPQPDCLEQCIEQIQNDATNFTISPGTETRTVIYLLNRQGRSELRECLRGCGYSGSLFRFVWLQAIARLEGEATYKGDPTMPAIPKMPD